MHGGMYHYVLSKCLLLHRFIWRSQRPNEVSTQKKLNLRYNEITSSKLPIIYIHSRIYAENIQRPFGVKYNPYTQTVDVLSSAKRITAAVSELRGDLSIVSSALRKVSALDQDLDVAKITQMLQSGLQVLSFPKISESNIAMYEIWWPQIYGWDKSNISMMQFKWFQLRG